MYFFSVLHVDLFIKLHLTILDSFCISFLSSHSSCRGLFVFACSQKPALTSVLPCVLVICPVVCWAFSDAALNTTRLCPNIFNKRKHLPIFTKVHPALSSLLFFFASFSSFFSISLKKRLSTHSLHFFHHFVSL